MVYFEYGTIKVDFCFKMALNKYIFIWLTLLSQTIDDAYISCLKQLLKPNVANTDYVGITKWKKEYIIHHIFRFPPF
jgi:hypothetical protein